MNDTHISAFLLERYHIDEVTPEEKLQVENALVRDPDVAAALTCLEKSDQDFWQRFGSMRPGTRPLRVRYSRSRSTRLRYKHTFPPLVWGICAAAAILVIALPLFMFRNPAQEAFGDRMKGNAHGNSTELSVYLKGSSAGKDIKLSDQAGIQAGNTIQLSYHVQPETSGERYGVIFSVDGRASVTLHYPYTVGQSTRLVSGKAVPLDEAYTLDDAPDFEIFFFVVGDRPLEVRNILNTAQHLAAQITGNSRKAVHLGTGAFKDYELTVLTLQKKK